jgi:hypothetical protein
MVDERDTGQRIYILPTMPHRSSLIGVSAIFYKGFEKIKVNTGGGNSGLDEALCEAVFEIYMYKRSLLCTAGPNM